jgi:hypothetical protein
MRRSRSAWKTIPARSETPEIVLRAKRIAARSAIGGIGGGPATAPAAPPPARYLCALVDSVLGNRRVLDQAKLRHFMVRRCGARYRRDRSVWPRVLAWPLSIVATWIGCGLLVRYLETRRASRAARNASVKTAPAPTEADRTKA